MIVRTENVPVVAAYVEKITAVRLKVEQNQLVLVGG
jgi:hypothetical protein